MKLTIHSMSEVTYCSLDIEVPSRVMARGEAAIVKWMNDNISTVDNADYGHSEITRTRVVNSITIER